MEPVPAVIPTASWTIVMSFGVVSTDLFIVHQPVLSAIMLWGAAAVWLFLVAVLGAPLAYRRDRFRHEVSSPVVLASVAATAVLGTRLAIGDHRVVAVALLVIAVIGWVLLVVPVLRHWKTPTIGSSFILGVATDGLALLSATLSVPLRAHWLVSVAGVFLLVGLAFYVFTAARFDLRQLMNGHGDHWVVGGALAISALAAGKITEAAVALEQLSALHHALTVGTLVLWCLAVAWILPLVITEVARPRLGYDVRRWATVFPFGMYAACSFTVGELTGISGITAFARTGVWVAVGITLLVLAGLIRRIHHTRRRRRPESSTISGTAEEPPCPTTTAQRT